MSTSRSVRLAIVLTVVSVVLAGLAVVSYAQAAKVKDPVCGMSVDPATAKHSATHEGTTYYFCSESCLDKFKKDPGQYLAKAAKVKDPVCGMTVDPSTAKYSTTHDGKTYHFCSQSCLDKFKKEPGKYIK